MFDFLCFYTHSRPLSETVDIWTIGLPYYKFWFTTKLLLLKNVGSARLRENGIHPISPKTPAPQYQPIDRKKRKGKRLEDYSRDRAA